MKVLKKIFIGLSVFIILLVSVYYLFTGFVLNSAIKFSRLSAGLERHEIKAGKFNWVYLDGGKGEIVILLHGFTGNKDTLGDMLPAFSKSYRVIAPDLPGCGETGFVEGENYLITNAAELFEEFVKQLNLESFHLFGVSSSGGIATYYASRYPRRVKTLSVIGPFGIQSEVKSDFQKIYEKGENPLVIRTAEEFDLKMSYIAFKPVVVPANIKSYLAKESAKTYDFYINVFKKEIEAEGWDMLRKHLKNITSPALVIFGDKDRFVDVTCIDVFKREIRNVKTYIMKDAGHVTYMDKPEETNSVIMNFIKENTKK